MKDSRTRRQTFLICLGLGLSVLAVYAPLWGCGFIDYDDPTYVTANPFIQHGVNAASLSWALTASRSNNWHPLTWISHILDFGLYGNNAAGHHSTSLLLHLANTILLFFLLQRLTKTMWASALAAALFGLHPMHVESVAWISERKDVLSTLFWMLTVWAYVRYVEESRVKAPRKKVFYAGAVALFALGLMAKPMLVTLPFVLLLLDYWPLQRFPIPARRLLAEKIPFFVLAAGSCLVTYLVQLRTGAVASLSDLPMGERLKGIPIAYVRYMMKNFWPAHLAVLYPVPVRWPVWEAAGAAAFLTLFTIWALSCARARPFMAVGWLWFLGTLVPVIGLVQVGGQSMADRYDYIPSIGLFLCIIWAGREWLQHFGTWAPVTVGTLALAGCLVLTPFQVSLWKNSETLFRHVINTTEDNGLMEGYLGEVLLQEGRVDEALPHLLRGVEFTSEKVGVHGLLGQALLAKGRVKEALAQFQIDINLNPENADSQFNLGCILLDHGRPAEAVAPLQKAVQIRPDAPEFNYKLGNAFMQTGRAAEAIRQFDKALHFRPDYIEAAVNLSWILATHPDASLRNGARAIALAGHADQLSAHQNPMITGLLAAAYAEAGKFSDAIATARRALQMVGEQSNSPMASTLRAQLELYRAGSAFRDTHP